jgi:hypothetical protein
MEEKYLHCDVENDTICGLGLCFKSQKIVEYLYNFQEQELDIVQFENKTSGELMNYHNLHSYMYDSTHYIAC